MRHCAGQGGHSPESDSREGPVHALGGQAHLPVLQPRVGWRPHLCGPAAPAASVGRPDLQALCPAHTAATRVWSANAGSGPGPALRAAQNGRALSMGWRRPLLSGQLCALLQHGHPDGRPQAGRLLAQVGRSTARSCACAGLVHAVLCLAAPGRTLLGPAQMPMCQTMHVLAQAGAAHQRGGAAADHPPAAGLHDVQVPQHVRPHHPRPLGVPQRGAPAVCRSADARGWCCVPLTRGGPISIGLWLRCRPHTPTTAACSATLVHACTGAPAGQAAWGAPACAPVAQTEMEQQSTHTHAP